MKELEPAIPDHLRKPRTQPLGAPDDFKPLHPSYSARFDPKVTSLPLIYIGIQYHLGTDPRSAISNVEANFRKPNGPIFWDQAVYDDEAGYTNSVLVGYWDNRSTFEKWQACLSEDWWRSDASLDGDVGYFKESYTPSINDTETTFSHPYPEGYSKIAQSMSGKTDTHEYWGAARDRIPRAQTDALDAVGRPWLKNKAGEDTLGRHITVIPHHNLCLLRSGQDWTETEPAETEFYLWKVKPLLDKGMLEIRDEGAGLGCYFNRYMSIVENGEPIKKTYSLSAWHSLKNIETWVQTDTHLAIWGAGIRHFKSAGDDARLRLYHEMFVIKAEDQHFEYFNCHNQTGMLKVANTPDECR